MSRRSQGLIGTWSEIQRQQQRQREMQQRAWVRHQREQERQQRAAERAAARAQREQQAAYRQRREADARCRTDELDARVEELRGLLAAGCAVPPFSPRALLMPEELEPFSPGQLSHPVPMPDPAAFAPQTRGGWGFGSGRQAQEEARARYEHAWHQAQAAEAQRVRQLEAYRQEYQRWADARLAEIRAHNAGVAGLEETLRRGDDERAVVEYFSAALYAAGGWPDGFPRRLTASYDAAARQYVLNWELPGPEIVPAISAVRYMPGADREKETQRPAAERRELYRDVLAQCVLLTLHHLFAADGFGMLDSVALNGFVDGTDPATGQREEVFLVTVMVTRAEFQRLRLDQVSAPDCLTEGLRGQLSPRPEKRVPVRPGRLPEAGGRTSVSQGADEDGEEPDLYAMDPVEFEELIAELFRAMGMQAVTTQRSGDGGVDVDALDPDPIRGGKIVVQVKRYRNTVPPSAVRDLYGTVQAAGANKGILVTTSRFGPGSHAFAGGKPLTLLGGGELLDLLGRNGLRGRLGEPARSSGRGSGPASAPAPDVSGPDAPDDALDADLDGTSVLGMSWTGGAALDICALVCQGNRVLDEDQFVFFNNPANPDGTVRTMPGTGADRAAVWVRFDELPTAADRLVLVAATDPEADPGADLSGFRDARIRLSDPSGAELGRLDVSDGRPGETALVLGSFRKRANGDWDFVTGGRGYEGGLVELVEEYGVEVA
ncbi:restriction endonuclease [Streptomyces sp. WAC 00631]|uniref:restriction endonuclease n=1 Tax=Streptomyces sp. WAC 00631 TaxID=2203201 RepID=UPI00163CAD3B|nr:restriction endonuclease [Streptomyces sp. WAC 00631]MCC5034669.1 restriction endonuclease [Streptomyces sp. WAC 00631]